MIITPELKLKREELQKKLEALLDEIAEYPLSLDVAMPRDDWPKLAELCRKMDDGLDTRKYIHFEPSQLQVIIHPPMECHNLRRVCELIGQDNGLTLREDIKWPADAHEVEEELRAADLTPDQREVLAMGGDDLICLLVESKKLIKTDGFLCKAFDGEYRPIIYKE